MMITSIGTTADQRIPLGDFTILVGPNNSGKTQTLDDIHSHFISDDYEGLIVEDLEIDYPTTEEELRRALNVREHPSNPDDYQIRGGGPNVMGSNSTVVTGDDIFSVDLDEEYIERHFSGNLVEYLQPNSRLQVARQTQKINPHEDLPSGPLQSLYATEKLETDRSPIERIENLFRDTFGQEIRFDDSGNDNLRFRVSDSFEDIPEDSMEAYPVMEQYRQLDQEGEGYLSFVGIMISLLLSDNHVILLDEPAVFLHPAQARDLGQWIGEYSDEIAGQLIVASHDANFISGALSSAEDLQLLRLDRDGDNTYFHNLDSEVTRQLGSEPLLSSQEVVESVFHDGVIICEGGSDRLVYQAVAEQLLDENDFKFVQVNGKGSIKKITEVLSDTPIPVSAIVDIDILREAGKLRNLIQSIDEEGVETILERRESVEESVETRDEGPVLENLLPTIREFKDQLERDEHDLSGAKARLGDIMNQFSKWQPVKEQGLEGIPEDGREDASEIIEQLKSYNIFVVPTGELESWFTFESDQKTKELEMLEKVHQGACSEDLVDFVREVLELTEQSSP